MLPLFRVLVVGLIASSASLAAVTIQKVSATPTTMVIDYVAPNTSACTVQVADMNLPMRITSGTWSGGVVTIETSHLQNRRYVGAKVFIESNGPSQWEGWQTVTAVDASGTAFSFANATSGTATSGTVGYLVNDVNTSLFASSNVDLNHHGTVNGGRNRTLVLGRETAETALDGNAYSRALQADTRHIVDFTCGSDTARVDNKTNNIPLGNGGMVIPPRPYPNPLDPGMPTFDKRCQQELPSLVAYDPVIEPMSGILHTNGQVCGEYYEDRELRITPTYPPPDGYTDATVPTSTGWTNPDNILSDADGGAGTTTTSAGGTLCVRPRFLQMLDVNNNLPTYGMDGHSIDSIQLILSGASSTGTANVDVNLSFDGCSTAWFATWQTFDLTSTPSTFSFPNLSVGQYPKGAFGDWDASRLNPPTRVQGLSLRNNNGVADGTNVFRLPAAGEGESIGFFHPTLVGAPIIIGGVFPDYKGCPTTGPNAGTIYTVTAFNSPKEIVLSGTVAAGTSIYWCVPQPAWLIRPTSGTGTITIDYMKAHMFSSRTMEPDSGGGRNRGSASAVLDYYGNSGHLIQYDNNGLHWVSDETGEARRVGSTNFFGRTGLWNAGSCSVLGNSSLRSDSRTLLCNMRSPIDNHVVPVLFAIKWSGTGMWTARDIQNGAWAECTDAITPSPNPCAVGTPVIDGSGYTLADLLVNFDPTFDPTKFTNCGLGEPIGDVAPASCSAGNQDSLGWLGVINFTKLIANYNPSDPSTNPIIALLGPSTVGMMMNVLHSSSMVSEQALYIGQKPGRTPEDHNWFTADGPFKMNPVADMDNTWHACPSNYHGYTKCSTVQVKTEPFDPDPWGASTGAPGEYGTYSIDGALQLFPCMSYGSYPWSCVAVKAAYPTSATDTEIVRVLTKTVTPPLITYEVARDITNVGLQNWSTFDTCGITGVTAGVAGSNVFTCGKPHGLYTGQSVTVSGITGMTGANGTHFIQRLSSTTFSSLSTAITGTFGGTPALVAPMPVCWITSITVGNPTTIGCSNATGLTTGDSVTLTGITGLTGAINATHSVTVTGPKTFTVPVSTSGTVTPANICAINYLNYNQNGNIIGVTCTTEPGLAAGGGAIVDGLTAQGVSNGTAAIIGVCQECNQAGPGGDTNKVWLMNVNSNGTPWVSGGTLSVMGVGTIPVRAMLMSTHLSEGGGTPSDTPGVWEFVKSPHGTTNASITTPLLSRYYGYPSFDMSHVGCTPLGGAGGCIGLGSYGFMAYTPFTGAQVLAPTPSLYSQNTYAFFLGKPALATPNTTEIYFSTGDIDCGTAPWCRQSINSSPTPYHIPGNGETSVWERVPATTYVFRMRTYARGENDGVRWPYYTWKSQWFAGFQGYKPLLNVSGPTTLLTDTLTDVGKMCFVLVAGQCWSGSKPYEQYIVADKVNTIYNDSYYYCSPIGAKDNLTLCVYPWHWLSNMGVRYNWGLNSNLRYGQDYQMVSHSFMHGNAGGYGQVPKLFPTGKLFGPLVEIFGPDRIRTKAFYAKVPIIPNYDNLNRLNWIPYTVPISGGPAGTAYVQVEYGYDTFSDPANGVFRCGDFQDNCIAGSTVFPNPYQAIDGIPAGSNLQGDYYVVTAINPTTIFIPGGHKFAAGSKLVVGNYGNVEVSLVDTTHFSIDNSTVSGTISTITAGAPATVTTVAPHGMATGTKVKLSSSGMTNADGNWFITVTSPTTFTLDFSNVSGTYGGGGTLTSVLAVSDLVSVGWYRQDSPYQYASESCTITAVSNATPPEVTCADNHNWQSGNTVRLSGVTGALNTVWTITYTGLSTFTLNGATASGTFSSGTAVPGGVACSGTCATSISVPALSNRRMVWRLKYRRSDWSLIANSPYRLEVTP